ncbi:MAG: FtsX-like permease family protein [Reichenbachiella sp.]|uniref:FtsX-like permease family protein n=1 Tax=Reichenbachiella sp. TaxID=2184521 RepID=UPI0032638B86
MSQSKIPSKFERFFEWFCKPELFEELQGDLEEAFEVNKLESGVAKAKNIYRMEVIKMIRPSVIRFGQFHSKFNHLIMFKNYYKTSIRSLMKNPLSSFINVFGLSVAIGVCLLVYGFIEQDINIDRFHKNKYEVYLTTFFADRDGTVQQFGRTPTPLGRMLREDFTHIKKVCRVEDNGVILKYKDKVFHERVRFTDPEFLEMFTFPLKWGLAASLKDMNSIIFSEDMSIKYFGEENPVGQDVLMKFADGRSKTFTITGVAEPFPKAHAIDFDFLINFENFRVSNPEYDLTSWSAYVNATLIQVERTSDLEIIMQGMDKYRILQNKAETDWAISSFAFEQLATLHEKSNEIRGDISSSVEDEARIILPIIGMFMLLLACFNYINIAIVSAAKRLKEIGVRKVIGANRRALIIQFLAENIFISFFAMLFGLVLGKALILPWFNQLFDLDVELRLFDPALWIFLFSILLFTGVASGIYPAFYISKFQVVRILKGSVKFGKKNPLTKIFLGVQLILACITITNGIIFSQNSTYQAKRSWGYNPKGVLYTQVPDRPAYEQLSALLEQDPNVLAVSGSRNHLGKGVSVSIVHLPDHQYEVWELSVDATYLETMQLQLAEGRNFREGYESDKKAIIVNELLVEQIGLEEPIGQVFKIDSMRYEIIGVAQDYHIFSFYNEIRPTILRLEEADDYRYLSMRVRDGKEKESYEALQSHWSNLFPETPFQGGYQNEVFGNYFVEIGGHAKFMKAVAFIAIMLASLGLYGLVTLNVSGRVREFSIRKVLGAQIKNLAFSITKQYVVLFAIALTIGAPISYILIDALLDLVYPYHIPMNYFGVLLAVIILITVLMATISTQIGKVSKSNPVEGIRVE